MDFNENMNEQMADGYRKKYASQVAFLESSLLSKVQSITPQHIASLGKQLDMFETYKKMVEASGNLNNLGLLPRVALDVIPAVMGQLPIATIASVQPIEGQKGIIHFKNVAARTTKGNRTDGQVFLDPRTGEKLNQGFASNHTIETLATGDGSAKTFSAVLSGKPSRSQFLKVSVDNEPTIKGADVGVDYGGDKSVGQIYGQGVFGTVNYETGLVSLTFSTAPATGHAVKIEFQQNLEKAADLPAIESYWDSRTVEAQVYALKSTIGMLQQFALQKQYGESALDELSADLIRSLNQEIFGDLLVKILGAAPGTSKFYRKAPTGVSYFEHKMTYTDQLALANADMAGRAGRGQISVMVVGRQHAAVVEGIPGFKKLSDGKALGAHIFGELNGVVYVRVNEDAMMGGDGYRGVGIFKGDSPFDAAAVYAPFMPLAVTSDLPMANPLNTQRAAATMAAVDLIVPQYLSNFNVVDTQDPTLV
jgi:hypothetical protein